MASLAGAPRAANIWATEVLRCAAGNHPLRRCPFRQEGTRPTDVSPPGGVRGFASPERSPSRSKCASFVIAGLVFALLETDCAPTATDCIRSLLS